MNILKSLFPIHFGSVPPNIINKKALSDAHSRLAQYLIDRETLDGYIASCQTTIARLEPTEKGI